MADAAAGGKSALKGAWEGWKGINGKIGAVATPGLLLPFFAGAMGGALQANPQATVVDGLVGFYKPLWDGKMVEGAAYWAKSATATVSSLTTSSSTTALAAGLPTLATTGTAAALPSLTLAAGATTAATSSWTLPVLALKGTLWCAGVPCP